jgi:hypothetical protein
MTSTGPPGLIFTVAVAFGKHPELTSFAPRTMLKTTFSFALAVMPEIAARIVVTTTVEPIDRNAFIISSEQRAQKHHVQLRVPDVNFEGDLDIPSAL